MIKAIIFDWGGVLIDNPAQELVEYIALQLGASEKELTKHFETHIENFQRSRITEEEFYGKFLKSPLEKSMWKKAVQNCFRNKPEMWQLITKLRKEGYKTGFLSNTENPAVEHFLEGQYHKYFDAIIFSCHEGIAKPDTLIYDIILRKLKVNPQEAIFIDDKLENIEAADKLKIRTIHFKSVNQCIEELKKILEESA